MQDGASRAPRGGHGGDACADIGRDGAASSMDVGGSAGAGREEGARSNTPGVEVHSASDDAGQGRASESRDGERGGDVTEDAGPVAGGADAWMEVKSKKKERGMVAMGRNESVNPKTPAGGWAAEGGEKKKDGAEGASKRRAGRPASSVSADLVNAFKELATAETAACASMGILVRLRWCGGLSLSVCVCRREMEGRMEGEGGREGENVYVCECQRTRVYSWSITPAVVYADAARLQKCRSECTSTHSR